MGRRYYCDYCDRSFIDDLEARKKHIQGTLHSRNRKLHYRQYRDLKTVVEDESAKTECRRFLQTGQCQFGDHCNYTHYSQLELNEFRRQVEEEMRRSKSKLPELPTVDSWLEKHNKKCLSDVSIVQPLYPPNSADLPASLRPMNFYDVVNVELYEWG
ncbi:zinc finger matrin-type protein 5 [Lycorma delicatula]|uniref:zinc finger matrin-type protein 5 n=1 Tax=Lycorma delicatula TaxID=130591 RepID=UPI003F50DFEB